MRCRRRASSPSREGAKPAPRGGTMRRAAEDPVGFRCVDRVTTTAVSPPGRLTAPPLHRMNSNGWCGGPRAAVSRNQSHPSLSGTAGAMPALAGGRVPSWSARCQRRKIDTTRRKTGGACASTGDALSGKSPVISAARRDGQGPVRGNGFSCTSYWLAAFVRAVGPNVRSCLVGSRVKQQKSAVA
jgi:hypothetical protein